jgi:hypothetical protein
MNEFGLKLFNQKKIRFRRKSQQFHLISIKSFENNDRKVSCSKIENDLELVNQLNS